MKYPVILSIAGSDSGGGAGIQADIKAMSAIGVFATTAITAVTAQNTQGVTKIQSIDPDIVAAQIKAVFSDFQPIAVKIGMLFSDEIIKVVAEQLEIYKPKYIILDPVMISTSGSNLISDNAIDCMLEKLFPLATILTPNRFEAERISGIKIDSEESMHLAAKNILSHGGKYVLIKGGHFNDSNMTDYLFDSEKLVTTFSGKKIETNNTHGTGCTLSSAIASYLALGYTIEDSICNAKQYLQTALEKGAHVQIGHGNGPVNHFFNPQKLVIL